MFSAEVEKRSKEHENQRQESERLALRKKDVRRNVHKYDRRGGGRTKVRCPAVNGVGHTVRERTLYRPAEEDED